MPHDDMMIRRADFRPASLDRAKRTVRVTVSTGAAVRRRGYIEKLKLPDPQTIVGKPVLNAHRQDSLDNLVGRVIGAGLDAEGLWADILISERADWLLSEIEAGIINSASIGYAEGRATESVDPVTRERVRTVEPVIREISFVPVSADAGATVRSQAMPEDQVTTQPTPEETEAQRRSDIRALVRSAGLGPEVADQLIDAQADMTRAKAEVYDALQTRNAARPIIRVHGSSEDPAVASERQAEAMHIRMSGGEVKPEIRPFMGNSCLDIARDSLARAGVSTRGLSPDEVFTRAGEMTTSDFPLIVSNAMGKTAVASYTAAECQIKKLGRQRTLSNFKTSTSIRAGELGRLDELDESGEIKHVTRAESGESMQLATYAAGLNISRKMLHDDDLNLMGDMTAAFGEAAAQTEADILVALVTGNPDMSDGNPVFDASRGNIAASGEPLSSATAGSALAVARKHFRQVKGLDGKTLINVAPKILLCGPENEEAAERLLTSIYAATVDDVNVHANKLTLLIEPRITDLSWFLFSDPARLAALQYGYLSSAQGVQIQRADAWSTLGLKFRAWLDFGAGWLEWRAAYLNEGA